MERALVATRPLWMKQAEEAKLKDEEQKAAAARAAFDATFKYVDRSPRKETASSDSEADETDRLANKPIGPVDPSKCTAAGSGVGGGAAGAAESFVVVTKDFEGRRIPHGGDQIRAIIAPGLGVGGVEQEAMVKDNGDGTYTVSYAVAKRGNYMVRVECNGKPILGSPFPVFFSAGSLPMNGSVPYPNGVNQGAQNYSGTMPGLFSGMLGMIPGIRPGASAGVVLPGLGASLGEVCQDYLNGQCALNDCKFNHPPYSQLMAALAPGSTMGGLSHMPMAPSAAAMAAAQAIVAAQALQAHAAQAQSAGESAGSKSHNGSSSYQNEQDKNDSSQHPPLPMMMQQAVAMQQLQFKQALLMQQSMATQQAASRAASMKSATEMASARAAEISKTLKVDGDDIDEKAASRKSISPRSRAKSRSRSRSPARYRHGRRSRSPPIRYQRDRHSRSPVRAYRGHRNHGRGRSYYYRDERNNYQKLYSRRDWLRSRDEPVVNMRRKRSRSRSRSRTRKSPRASSSSPRHHRERRNSPNMHKEEQKSTYHSRRSRSMSKELRENIMDNEDVSKNPQESSRKQVKEVNKVEKHDVLQDIEEIKEEKYDKDSDKPENYRKNLIRTGKGTDQDNAREERIKVSKTINKDSYSDKKKVSEKTDDVLMQMETTIVEEENIKEKRRHTKKSTVEDDGENFTEKKSHRKEKRAYEDEYEVEEKRSHKKDRKPLYSDVKEMKEKSQRRKGNEKDYEVDEASKRYKERSKKEHDSDKVDKKKRKYKYGPMSASGSSEGSPAEDVDRGNSSHRKYHSRHSRKYRGVSKSVSPGHSFED